MTSLPTGTVTFLFTDIEGSTKLLQRLGDGRYAEVLAEHQRLLRDAFAKGNGHEVGTQGDAFLVAFPRASDAVSAAVAAQQALMQHTWPDGASLRVRMGLHTGEPLSGDTGYVGIDVHRAARIAAAGHGGQILLSDAVSGLVARDLPSGVSLRDLGTHRLKDLREPEHLLQVVHPDLSGDFPPLKSFAARSNNLPIQLTSFVGREREKAEVRRLLSTIRLLTLTGSGGAGKTRLALQVAAEALEEFPDGVWLVELAALTDPGLVPKAAASALGMLEQPGRGLTEALADSLRRKSVLVILDNCEHLVAACAQLTDTLLRACPNLRVLTTSREALGVTGETTWRVPSLSVPDPQRLPSLDRFTDYEAVRLFIDRAVASEPQFALTSSNASAVAQVCHRLDGIPLALELAAARVKVLAVEQIAARLDDRFRLLTGGSRTALPHHRTLRATLDWSYNLLSERERVLLRRLSVFAGGFTLEAAEKICAGGDVADSGVLDLLTRLVDKSLVAFDERDRYTRYRLLETVRQYGVERLQDANEAAAVRGKHRDWYLAHAEEAERKLNTEAKPWLERLEVEHDNLRVALDWSGAEQGGTETELRLAGALWGFWFTRGYWHEGRDRLERALARGAVAPHSLHLKALQGAHSFAWGQGDDKRAAELSEKGLRVCEEAGDEEGKARFLVLMAIEAIDQGDHDRAAALCEDALAVFRKRGDLLLISWALHNQGVAMMFHGDYERARVLIEESLAFARPKRHAYRIAHALRSLGLLACLQGDYRRAPTHFKDCLIRCEEVGGMLVTAECLAGLAWAAAATGVYEHAARLFGAVEALFEATGYRAESDMRVRARFEQHMASTRAHMGDSAFDQACEQGRAMTLEQAIEYALKAEGN